VGACEPEVCQQQRRYTASIVRRVLAEDILLTVSNGADTPAKDDAEYPNWNRCLSRDCVVVETKAAPAHGRMRELSQYQVKAPSVKRNWSGVCPADLWVGDYDGLSMHSEKGGRITLQHSLVLALKEENDWRGDKISSHVAPHKHWHTFAPHHNVKSITDH